MVQLMLAIGRHLKNIELKITKLLGNIFELNLFYYCRKEICKMYD